MENEDAKLTEALANAEPLLLASLRKEDQRRRRRLVLLTTLGGVIMGSIITALVLVIVMSGQVTAASAGAANPGSADALTQEGWQLWQQRQLPEATTKFRAAVKLNPKASNAWNGLGWALFNSGQTREAEDAFGKCVKLVPGHPAALNGLGQAALSRADLKTAEKYLLAAAPQAPAAWWGLTRMYLLQERYDDALKWAQKIVASDPKNPQAQQMLDAAKERRLDPALREMIAPPGLAEPATEAEKPPTTEPAK